MRRGPPPIDALRHTSARNKTRTRSSQRGRAGDILEAMHAQTPVQIAWVTTDLDATEKRPDHAVGRQEVDPHARRALRSRHVHVPRSARRFRRTHLVQLCRRHPARADRTGDAATASTPSFSTAPDRDCTTSVWRLDDLDRSGRRERRRRGRAARGDARRHASSPTSPPRRQACPTSRSHTSRPRSGRSSTT